MIIFLMNKTVIFCYWFIIVFIYMCSFNNAFAKEPIAGRLNYKGKYTSDIENYEIVVPQRVNKDGNFISHLVSHHHSKRSTKELDFIFYKIPIAGKDYLIELTPNRKLISPGAVVEVHKEESDISRKRGFGNESLGEENPGKLFQNLNIRKLKNTDCHFSGRVKGENVSKAALSTCYGLAGFIQIKKGFYTIEPIAEHDPFVEDAYPHILYKTDSMENSSVCQAMGELTASLADQVVRKRRDSNPGVSGPMYIETLIVLDKTLINYHQDLDCENYILTVFNMAFNLFHDASLGLMMTLTIVRIIRLEVENDEMNLKMNADAEKTLRYFQTWQSNINPGDDSHPNHHDIAILITRVNVCYSPSSCGLLGLTTIGKACDPNLSAALCEDNGLRLGFVIAHEIGHLLGAGHDSDNSSCNGTDAEGLKTVMHPHIALNPQTWSKCSQAFIKAFIESGTGNCLLDEPEEHHFNVQDLLPGVMYNADFQCKHIITMRARECEMGSTCESLNCYVPGYACVVTHNPPADGTRCGENMWCHDAKCLVVGERPGAIDGNWGEWSAWSECSRTCGSGVASSVRQCDKPLPSHGGKSCVGERKRYKVCAATFTTVPQNLSDLIRFISEEVNVSFVGKPCETGRPSFRDIQCGEFDDWIYPEDGKIHTWKAHYFHDDNPCTLYCINEENQIAALRPRVVDGTMCYKGIRDICVGGACKNLPCDLHFESNAVEDACGVCHGDGTACEFSEGIETFTKLTKGLTKLVNIPSGTRNIKVEEMSPTLARIIVRDKDTKDIYVRGKTLGMFNVPGSQAWLGMTKKNQEALNIPGPINKPLSVWIQRLENVTVKWSMALPAEQQRKPEFAWDFLKWGPCSAKCGPGAQKSEPSCMEEKAGLVEDTFCADLEMPLAKIRPCEVAICEPRWMVGDWKGCDSISRNERKRVVYCIKPVGEGEGESQIVADSECLQPKPHDKEECGEKRKKREDTEYFSEGSFLGEGSMYPSRSVEFGFHKKYDDYLKHFAALPVPQRKCETIPVHLLSSPHFKEYFRVLETPESFVAKTNSDSDSDINLANFTIPGSQPQSKVSSNFCKNTFSGHQIDVSHLLSKVSLREDMNLLELDSERRVKKNLDKELRGRRYGKDVYTPVKIHKIHTQRDPQMLIFRKLKDNFLKNNKKICKDYESSFNKVAKPRLGSDKVLTDHNQNDWTLRNKNLKANEKYFSRKLARSPRYRLSPNRNKKKIFNRFSQNLTDFIETLSNGDDLMKDEYLKLINRDNTLGLTPLEKSKLRNYQWNAYNPQSVSHRLSGLLRPFSHLLFSRRAMKDKFEPKIVEDNQLNQVSKLKSKDFDGSGFRRLNVDADKSNLKNSLVEEGNKANHDLKSWIAHDKRFIPNPFDPTRSGRLDFQAKKGAVKEDLPLEKKTLRFDGTRLRNKNAFFLGKRSVAPSLQKKKRKPMIYIHVMPDNYKINKRKRSSRRWKKPKLKDSNGKSTKEFTASGYGTETKNYLNNLFKDSHPKIFTKQESKSQNEKPVIKSGELVIDKDALDDQQVEVLFQKEEGEEKNQAQKFLPPPPGMDKKMTLKGKQVFDFLQKLQTRGGRDTTCCKQINGSNPNLEKIEINVNIPGSDRITINCTTEHSPGKSGESTSNRIIDPGDVGSTPFNIEDTTADPAESTTAAKSANAESTTAGGKSKGTTKGKSKGKGSTTTEMPGSSSSSGSLGTTGTTGASGTSGSSGTSKGSDSKTTTPASQDYIDCLEYDLDEPPTETTTETKGSKNESKKKAKYKTKTKTRSKIYQDEKNDPDSKNSCSWY